MVTKIIEITGWKLNYIMDGISIGALKIIIASMGKKNEEANGLLMNENFDAVEMKDSGLIYMEGQNDS
jgi:hypothetical protein